MPTPLTEDIVDEVEEQIRGDSSFVNVLERLLLEDELTRLADPADEADRLIADASPPLSEAERREERPRIIELLELASGVWTHESDFTYPKPSREVVRVVTEELQHHRPLAGSSLPGQDDLWNIVLEYAIGRD